MQRALLHPTPHHTQAMQAHTCRTPPAEHSTTPPSRTVRARRPPPAAASSARPAVPMTAPPLQPACLVLLQDLHESPLSSTTAQALLEAAHARNCRRVYVATPPGQPQPGVNAALLEGLAGLYAAVGAIAATWEVVPCLACAGWTQERLAALPDVQLVLAPDSLQQAASALQQLATTTRQQQQQAGAGGAAGVVELQLVQPVHAVPQQQRQGGQQQQQPGGGDVLAFPAVAVGGTFDRLHAGHRLLLAGTALVASSSIFVGITADSLLAKKANKHLLQDYDARRGAAVDFMALVRPGVTITAGPLTDPQEPTQAELDAAMAALVVSRETLAGGEAINTGRLARGFQPLQLVVVGLVGGDGSKLSSTQLRQAEAEGGGRGGGGASTA